MADVPGKFFKATKVRTGVSPSSPGVIEGETLPPLNPPGGSLNSVGLSMPSAFNVANSPLTSNGTLAVTGAGTVGQYIRGDGSLADFPQASGGGSSVSYYLNGSVNQGTIGGVAYRELSKVPILGAGTDFTINADGYIASFITDAGDPNLLEIPGGNWNFETYFSASSGGGSPTFYVELYKVSGTTATLIASSSSSPELIAFGTNLTPYYSTLAVPTTTLALTDRLAVRYYVSHSGRTITLHTENNHLCQIITTFTTGLTALNGLTAQVQNFAVGTSGTDFNIASATATHTFNLPTASATNRGALSSADWSLFRQAYNDKINSASVTGTTTKTLTLVQQDGGEIQASWSDLNTDAVTSVFGRTGAVVAVSGDYNTSQVTESGNLYFTQARVSANTDVAANTAARHNAVTLGTANGLSLSTQQLSLGLASGSTTGALSSTDWNTFNNKENAITAGTTAQYFRGDKTFQTLNTGVVPESGNLYFTNARAIASTLTGYVSGAGTLSSADSILTAIQKLNGNIGALVTGVSSVNGQTGAVTLTTTNIGEGTNLYFTNARSRAALSFAAGSGAYNSTTGVITIPTDNNQIANGANYITAAALSAYLPLAGGTMTGVITTPNGTFGIVIGDDSRLADRNVANTLFLEGVQNNDRGYINFSQTSGNALGAVNGGDLTWRGNVVLHAANFNSYAPTLGGTGATGTWSIAITGNAGTANTWTTARTITIGNTGKSVNGSANVAWSLAEIGAYAATNPSAFIALTALSGVAPIQYNNTTGSISITQASGSTNGFLSSTDWTTFNNKQNALTNPVTGTGTTNRLPKFTGTSTIGDSTIQDNTSSIVYTFSSNPVLNITDGTRSSFFGTATTAGAYVNASQVGDAFIRANNGIVFSGANGTGGELRLTSAGNLGLGVTPSAWISAYRAFNIGLRGFVYSRTDTQETAIGTNWYRDSNGSFLYTANGFASYQAQQDSVHYWFNAPSGTAGQPISFTPAMTLTSDGNLLVGTASNAGFRMSINGPDGTSYVKFTSPSATTGGRIGYNGNEMRIDQQENANLIFRTNGSTHLTIASSGAATFSSSVTAGGNVLVPAGSGLAWSGDASRIMTPEDNVSGALIQTPGIIRFNAGGTTPRVIISALGALLVGTSNTYSNLATQGDIVLQDRLIFGADQTGNANNRNWSIETNSSQNGSFDIVSSSANNNWPNAAYRLTLTRDGNLGLGVTPSGWASDFRALQIGLGTSLYNNGNTNGTFLGSNFFFNGSNNIYIGTGTATAYAQSLGTHAWYTAPSGTAGNAISFTQAMTLFATGNLLVGTPSPISDNGARLQVSGEGRFYQPLTNTTSYLTVENNRARNAAIRLKTTVGDFYLGTGIGADVNQFQIFDGTAGVNRLVISSTGAATFSSSVTAPEFILNNGSADGGQLVLASSGFSNWNIDNFSGSLRAYYGSTEVLRLNAIAQSKLYINGGSSTTFMQLTGNNRNMYIGQSLLGLDITQEAYADMVFATNATYRMRINADGNVWIGSLNTDTGDKLRVVGTTFTDIIKTSAPTGTSQENWRLGRALLATSSVPEDRWIRVQLGNRIYDILAIDRGLA